MAVPYHPRHIEPRLLELCEDHPVVVLTGARQTGKSTLLRHLFAPRGFEFVDLDDFDQLDLAQRDPEELLAGRRRVVIDEAQRAPGILLAVKRLVDQRRDETRVVVSGSANLLLLRSVAETLAGRAVPLTLQPMSLAEGLGHGPPRLLRTFLADDPPAVAPAAPAATAAVDLHAYGWRGGMPPLLGLRDAAVTAWWEGYVATYLERDVLAQAPLHGLMDFRRTCQAAALRLGQAVNMADLARDVGVSATTVRRYLDLLEATHQIDRLPAFAVNRTKRLLKSPKLYAGDSGLACFLAGHHDQRAAWGTSGGFVGALLEQVVVQQLRVEAALMQPVPRLHHWRTSDQKEVDFVVEWGRRLLAIEVKRATTARYGDADGLRLFLHEYADFDARGVLLYGGAEPQRLGERIWAVPLRALGGTPAV
jgi:hypothetical protein